MEGSMKRASKPRKTSQKRASKPKKTRQVTHHESPGGIAHHPDSFEETGADEIFTSANYTVTSTTDGGDALLTNVEVTVIFWGDFWNVTSPAPNVSVANYFTAFSGVV